MLPLSPSPLLLSLSLHSGTPFPFSLPPLHSTLPFPVPSCPPMDNIDNSDNKDMAQVATMPPPTNTAATSPTTTSAAANRRYRPAPAKTFQCRGYGDCRMVFSRSEHLARHIRHVPHSYSLALFDFTNIHLYSTESTLASDHSLATAASNSLVSTIFASMLRPSMPTNRIRTSA